jgi:DNA-binding transcriptional regulator GbsR (MarR family)
MNLALSKNKTDALILDSRFRTLELESIDFFVRMMGILGMPRSVGEIYGLLYFSESPLSMDKIASRLEISIGSASQGLKTLKSLKAVFSTYVAGDRRDHDTAETEFRKLFSSFINDEIMPHLESANERITRMEQTLSQEKKLDEFHLIRLEKLKKLTKTGSRLLPALAGFLKI